MSENPFERGCQTFITIAGVVLTVAVGALMYIVIRDISKEALLLWAILATVLVFPAWLFGTWTSRFQHRAFTEGVEAGRGFATDAMNTFGLGGGGRYEVVDVPAYPADDPFALPQAPPPTLMLPSGEGTQREGRVDL